MNKHIKQADLKEKKLQLHNTIKADEIKIDEKEISKEHMDKVLKINNEVLKIFTDNKCTVNETYTILASMLESIYAYSILKDFGYVEK